MSHEPPLPQPQNPYWNQHIVGFNQPTYTGNDNNLLMSFWNGNGGDFIGDSASWDELRSVIDGNTKP
jgi:hypothetical protein